MANLPSQELLNKYRAEEKAAAQETPANPEQTNAETPNPETETQPTGSEEVKGNGEASQTTQPSSSESGAQPEKTDKGEERWLKTQESFKKRLDRQERSHRKTVDALNAEIAELKKQLNSNKADLKREDFPSVEAYENYRKEELKKEILAESRKTQDAQAEAQRRQEAARKRVESTFRTPEARQEFNETLSDFLEDNGDWLESEEGQLYQEIIDQSPVGLVMAMAIAKNSEVTEQMKNWSKDLLFQKLSQFENALLQNAKEAAKKQPSNGQPQTPTQQRPSTSGIPSTGSVGKTQAPATFNAKDWLRKNRPERYPTH
jgi:hypothetical protein